MSETRFESAGRDRGEAEPWTVRFSGVADAQLRSNVREGLAVYGWARALTAAIVAVKVAVGIPFRSYGADAVIRRGCGRPVAWHLAAPSVWLMGGCEMADDKGIALARRSRSAPKAMRISPRNKVNVALPLSMIRADEPVKMRVGDWISVAGLVITVIGFGVAIRQLSRIADALEPDQASHRASREERESLAGGSSSADVRIS